VRIERIAYCNVRCPRHPRIRAPRIEQLRIGVIRPVSGVQPNRINTPIGRYRERAKPMPFVLINWIVSNSLRCAEGQSAIGAAREHDVAPVVGAKLLHRGNHVNIVIGSGAGAIHSQKDLSRKSAWIDRSAKQQAPAEINCSDLVKCWRDIWVLCIARTNAPKLAAECTSATDKQIAVAGHVECSPLSKVGKTERTLPSDPTVRRTAKSAEVATPLGPNLVLKAVAHATGLIDGEPLLVTTSRVAVGLKTHPGLAEIWRAVHVVTERLKKAEVEKVSCLIGP